MRLNKRVGGISEDQESINFSSIVGLCCGKRKGELAVFCGAGISMNSGLPSARQLKKCILKKLPVEKNDMEEIMTSSIPFEAFMQKISGNSNISMILNIFGKGKPNTNHILIAKLAKAGYVRTILTTNFDLLIEKALEKEGLKIDKDFKVYYDEDQFSRIDFEKIADEEIIIFKIHGSIFSINSIRVTLKKIESKTLSDKRMNIIKYLFSTGKHEEVLILGYSCSDEFDITPQIQSIEKNQKKIVLIEHCKRKEKMEDIGIKDTKNPFKKGFTGKRIICDTDKFIEKFWHLLRVRGIIEEEYNPIKSEVEWRIHVGIWAKKLKQNNGYPGYSIAASIFHWISNFKKATKYYEKALRIAEKVGDNLKEFECYAGLGDAYLNMDLNKPIEYYKKCLAIARRFGDETRELTCHNGLGNAYNNLGDFNKALEYCKKVLEISKRLGNEEGESGSYIVLGNIYQNFGNIYYSSEYFDKALGYYKKALKIEKKIDSEVGKLICYQNLGALYDHLGNINNEAGNLNRAVEHHKKAIGYHTKCLIYFRKIGDRGGKSACYRNLGASYQGLGDSEKAHEYYKKSLGIYEKVGDRGGESACYRNLGASYQGLGNSKKALEYYKKSLETCRLFGDRIEESIICYNLGSYYFEFGCFNNAIEFFRKSLKIYKKIKYKVGVSECHNGLGDAYLCSGDLKNAIEHYKKSLKIDTETKNIAGIVACYINLGNAYSKLGNSGKARVYYSEALETILTYMSLDDKLGLAEKVFDQVYMSLQELI